MGPLYPMKWLELIPWIDFKNNPTHGLDSINGSIPRGLLRKQLVPYCYTILILDGQNYNSIKIRMTYQTPITITDI